MGAEKKRGRERVLSITRENKQTVQFFLGYLDTGRSTVLPRLSGQVVASGY